MIDNLLITNKFDEFDAAKSCQAESRCYIKRIFLLKYSVCYFIDSQKSKFNFVNFC